MISKKTFFSFTILLVALLFWSGINPYDRPTWLLEIFPVLVVLPILIFTFNKFPLTTLLYALIFFHAIVLMVGGAYTYARVPIGFQLADLFDLQRNPYDKLGHLVQGLVPAIAAREILIRGSYVHGKRMLVFIVMCIVLAISALYELVEWGTAVVLGDGAYEFLGTQGDPWDTQADMLYAFIGAMFSLLVFSRIHNRQIERLNK